MSALRATVHNRRIDLRVPDEFPDGTEVLVEMTPVGAPKIGIEEAEWRDDPAAIADWETWIKTIEPLELTPDEEKSLESFEKEFRRFNVEAVRQQMQEEADE